MSLGGGGLPTGTSGIPFRTVWSTQVQSPAASAAFEKQNVSHASYVTRLALKGFFLSAWPSHRRADDTAEDNHGYVSRRNIQPRSSTPESHSTDLFAPVASRLYSTSLCFSHPRCRLVHTLGGCAWAQRSRSVDPHYCHTLPPPES